MKKIRVLLVDDEEELIRALAERLEIRGLEVAVALNGEHALEAIVDNTPDVMILDLKMPGLDGMTVLGRVKQIAPAVQVIMVTGHGSDTDQETARRLGVYDYLQKPVDIDVLLKTIRLAYEFVASKEMST